MNREQYRAAIKACGFQTQGAAAKFFHANERTGRRWAKDGCPEVVAMMLRLMIRKKLSPKAASKFFNE